MLSCAGIEPGFFTVCNGINQMSSLPDDGTIYPKYQSAAHRFALNATNYFDKGCTKDLVFVIDGNEYRLDDNGYLHIPEGTACLTETREMIK